MNEESIRECAFFIAPFLTLIPLVFVIRCYRHKPSGWRALLVIAVTMLVIAGPFLIFFVYTAGDEIKEYRSRIAFDSSVWKASLSSDSDPIRLRMVDDLLRRNQLRGMHEHDLIALLGKPPQINSFEDYQLVYWLGPERGFMSIDSEWLAVRIGPDQRVAEARIVRD